MTEEYCFGHTTKRKVGAFLRFLLGVQFVRFSWVDSMVDHQWWWEMAGKPTSYNLCGDLSIYNSTY